MTVSLNGSRFAMLISDLNAANVNVVASSGRGNDGVVVIPLECPWQPISNSERYGRGLSLF
jgi:hypothetical protein